ncbi:NADH-quinone oxidoreductase subunit NuoE [Shewanella hanedai]|uniref:NADH-quinone oxidoreductase subunit E n=1 Tax=Shewanella hanedai TaxID=25 RepID=A0A553JMJ8_SHEHA|nr:NADH-quinone oxidoreductase subunit NuoE [Shewanella hanedai]TRY13630.1 NADH-quinone oxidoreductase subunit NuoE [Shewanella hanedai]
MANRPQQAIPIALVETDASGLSEKEQHGIDALISHSPQLAGITIDALKLIQAERGWISDASLNALSIYTNIPVADLDSVATFYNLIFRQPVGTIVLHPCDGISCDLMGAEHIRQCLSHHLNINAGETTADNHFTLIPLPCLGACDKAPVMIANKQLFENMTETEIPELIRALGEVNK